MTQPIPLRAPKREPRFGRQDQYQKHQRRYDISVLKEELACAY